MDRTNTTTLLDFKLPPPNLARFDFSDPELMRVTIPAGSTWKVPLHWHRTSFGCRFVISVEGPILISVAWGIQKSYSISGGAGANAKFKPGQRVAWCRSNARDETPLTAGFAADQNLYRNICSAFLDRDLLPHLSSTPFWLRALFGILTYFPTIRQRLLDHLWSLQLLMIYYAHDFNLSYGRIPFTWPWIHQPFGGHAPNWANYLDWTSGHVISLMVMSSCYGIGRLLCGMKGQYPQYTIHSRTVNEEKIV